MKKASVGIIVVVLIAGAAWYFGAFRMQDSADTYQAPPLGQDERVTAALGKEFIIRKGAHVWVDGLEVAFLSIEEDSRCPKDVQCIWAGRIRARFSAGGEEVELSLPGDQQVPNAAIVGSYIITLVAMDPVAIAGERRLDQGVYTATLRVEVHDIKG